jgi:hypothetical protein
MFNNFFLVVFENRDVYEKMWKNIVQLGRPQVLIKYGACALHVENPRQKHVYTVSRFNTYSFIIV